MAAAASKFEQACAQLRLDFLDSARERLDAIEALLYSPETSEEDPLLRIFRDVHSLKGSGATYGLQSISMIAHKLEDYLSDVPAIDDELAEDIVKFVDALRVVVGSGQDLSADVLRETLRELPTPIAVDLDVGSPLNVDILLVSPSRSVRQILSRNLRACGYHVTSADSPWKALQMAVCAQPDFIITSAVMSDMNGVDLINALRAISATQHLPVALLTSFTDDHPALNRLSSDTAVIRIGDHFESDLADALFKSGIA